MRFIPKTEKQVQEERFPLLPPGHYNFEIVDGGEQVSKKGNPMIVLRLRILDMGLNHLTYITDYLMESISGKLRHAAYVCGLGDGYERGELDAKSFIGKTGRVNIVIQKDKSGQYPDKNSIQDYDLSHPSDEMKSSSWEDNLGEPPEWVR